MASAFGLLKSKVEIESDVNQKVLDILLDTHLSEDVSGSNDGKIY